MRISRACRKIIRSSPTYRRLATLQSTAATSGNVRGASQQGGHRKVQIPGVWSIMNGTTYEQDGTVPRWRGIFDDEGRLMVAINFNMDMGDAWEHADDPRYPQVMTALAYRFGVNYVLYAMTH